MFKIERPNGSVGDKIRHTCLEVVLSGQYRKQNSSICVIVSVGQIVYQSALYSPCLYSHNVLQSTYILYMFTPTVHNLQHHPRPLPLRPCLRALWQVKYYLIRLKCKLQALSSLFPTSYHHKDMTDILLLWDKTTRNKLLCR